MRDIAGYCRYSGERGTSALQAVYNAYDLLPSLFSPCMKLVSKERAGSEYRKRSDAAKPPYQRLIEREDVPLDRKPALIDLKTSASFMEQKFLPDAVLLLAASCLGDNGKQKVFPCLKLESPEECPQGAIEFVTPSEIPAGFYKVFIAQYHQAVN